MLQYHFKKLCLVVVADLPTFLALYSTMLRVVSRTITHFHTEHGKESEIILSYFCFSRLAIFYSLSCMCFLSISSFTYHWPTVMCYWNLNFFQKSGLFFSYLSTGTSFIQKVICILNHFFWHFFAKFMPVEEHKEGNLELSEASLSYFLGMDLRIESP